MSSEIFLLMSSTCISQYQPLYLNTNNYSHRCHLLLSQYNQRKGSLTLKTDSDQAPTSSRTQNRIRYGYFQNCYLKFYASFMYAQEFYRHVCNICKRKLRFVIKTSTCNCELHIPCRVTVPSLKQFTVLSIYC